MKTDDVLLTVTLADGRVISTPLDWYPRLAHGTAAERSQWEFIGQGSGIHWPLLDEDISIEGLIAGRKSGEGAASLKRWFNVQDQMRKAPSGFRELRREVFQAGPLSATVIAARAMSTVRAYDGAFSGWSATVTSDPFAVLQGMGMNESSECAVFWAESGRDASEAVRECVSAGMVEMPGRTANASELTYVLIFKVM